MKVLFIVASCLLGMTLGDPEAFRSPENPSEPWSDHIHSVLENMQAANTRDLSQWQTCINAGIVNTSSTTGTLTVTIGHSELTVSDVFTMLQSYSSIFSSQGEKETKFVMNIGGHTRQFYLVHQSSQTKVITYDQDWYKTAAKGKIYPKFEAIVKELNDAESKDTIKLMLKSLFSSVSNQPEFEVLKNPAKVRAMVEFLLVTMVARSARPAPQSGWAVLMEELESGRSQPALKYIKENPRGLRHSGIKSYLEDLAQQEFEDKNADLLWKDKWDFVKRNDDGKLLNKYDFDDETDQQKEVSDYFRKISVKYKANEMEEVDALKRTMHERTKREYYNGMQCFMIDESDVVLHEDSVELGADGKLRFTISSKTDPAIEILQAISINKNKLVRQKYAEQLLKSRDGKPLQNTTKLEFIMGLVGLLPDVGGQKEFQDKHYFRGSVFLSQSLRSLGGTTKINEKALKKIISKLTKKVLSHLAKNTVKDLGLNEEVKNLLGKNLNSGEKFSVGEIPVYDIISDIFDIAKDIVSLIQTNIHDINSLANLPVKVIDLALDVSISILHFLGPETEPIVKVLSVVHFFIDNFYNDILHELEKVNWKSPCAVFYAIGAFEKGFLEGIVDAVSGGLLKEMRNLAEEHKENKQLVENLGNPDNYFNLTNGTIINMAGGEESMYGGNIFLALYNNQTMYLRIQASGDESKFIEKTYPISSDVKDVVMGVGESRTFQYAKKQAKLWWVIPVKSYDVICGENLNKTSLLGTYQGNNANNRFYAVQQLPNVKSKGKDCREKYGHKLPALNNFHYKIDGKEGDDIYFLGPQPSQVTGGEGKDMYIVQANGTVNINNMALDMKRDVTFINASFEQGMSCQRQDQDLNIVFKNDDKPNFVVVRNWFVGSNSKYNRHMIFRSADGYIFSAADEGFDANADSYKLLCNVTIIEKSAATEGQTINITEPLLQNVIQVVGSAFDDKIFGNDLDNYLDGAEGNDFLQGGNGSDKYMIRTQNETHPSVETIDNFAADNKTDFIVFDIPFAKLKMSIDKDSVKVCEDKKGSSCAILKDWWKGDLYQHATLISSDHVIFDIHRINNDVLAVPILIDNSESKNGVIIDLQHPDAKDNIKLPGWGYQQMVTIVDSHFADIIIGNHRDNFLSCTSSNGSSVGDHLEGGPGEDKYIIKKTCQNATIVNYDMRKDKDIVFISEIYANLVLEIRGYDLQILGNGTSVVLEAWFKGPDYQHLMILTADGVTCVLPATFCQVETYKYKPLPIEINKDPTGCNLACFLNMTCPLVNLQMNLTDEQYRNVSRLSFASRVCAYNITGNAQDNYIDLGPGQIVQHVEGQNGSDIYVVDHGYGTLIINNYAEDMKNDYLQLNLHFNSIMLSLQNSDLVLTERDQLGSVKVIISNYNASAKYQHLLIHSSDGYLFNVSTDPLAMHVIQIDMSSVDSSRNISLRIEARYRTTKEVYGSEVYSNKMLGNDMGNKLVGGVKRDILEGGLGNDYIDGMDGDDTLIGGAGADMIMGGSGDDVIYGQWGNDVIHGDAGADDIQGGLGVDTIIFTGNASREEGVYVDIDLGFGKHSDAEGDTYIDVENIWGSEFDDNLIGDNGDNEIHGFSGNDYILPKNGSDVLSGGSGSDTYNLTGSVGYKVIDNYDGDNNLSEDLILLRHSYSFDYLKKDNDLYLFIKDIIGFHNSKVIHENFDSCGSESPVSSLDVVMKNWFYNDTFRHAKFVFQYRTAPADEFSDAFDVTVCSNFLQNYTGLEISVHETYIKVKWEEEVQAMAARCNSAVVIIYKNSDIDCDSGFVDVLQSSVSQVAVTGLQPGTNYTMYMAFVYKDRVVGRTQQVLATTDVVRFPVWAIATIAMGCIIAVVLVALFVRRRLVANAAVLEVPISNEETRHLLQ